MICADSFQAIALTKDLKIEIRLQRQKVRLIMSNLSILTENEMQNFVKLKFRIFQSNPQLIFEQVGEKIKGEAPNCFFLDFFNRIKIQTPKTIKRNENEGFQSLAQIDSLFDHFVSDFKEKSESQNKLIKSSDEPGNLCPICFSVKSAKTSVLESCLHEYCFECLRGWVKNSNKCPQCKQISKFVEIKKNGVFISKKPIGDNNHNNNHKIEDHQLDVPQVNQFGKFDECCYRCKQNNQGFLMLVCDKCDKTCCHIYCLNPPLEYIPEEDWFCDMCQNKKQKPKTKKRR